MKNEYLTQAEIDSRGFARDCYIERFSGLAIPRSMEDRLLFAADWLELYDARLEVLGILRDGRCRYILVPDGRVAVFLVPKAATRWWCYPEAAPLLTVGDARVYALCKGTLLLERSTLHVV